MKIVEVVVYYQNYRSCWRLTPSKFRLLIDNLSYNLYFTTEIYAVSICY